MIRNYRAATLKRFSPRESLSAKLPLLISALLVGAIVLFSAVAYRQLTQALYSAAGARMKSAGQLVANLLEDSGRRIRTESERIAADSTVRRLSVAPDARSRARAHETFKRFANVGPQTLAVEFRDKKGVLVLSVAGNATDAAKFTSDRIAPRVLPGRTTVGPIVMDDGILAYGVYAAVTPNPGDTTGYVAVYRQLSSAQGVRQVEALIGSDASLLLGNADGKLWTDFSTVVRGPTDIEVKSNPVASTRPQGYGRIGAAVPMRSGPWIVWVAVPNHGVLAPARKFLRDMSIAAALLVIVGGLAALLISRQITGPLAEITQAAEGIAHGDYSRRVKASRSDELGILAESFNTMAEKVDDSTHQLENRVQERTRELEATMSELHDAQESLVRREKLVMLGQLAGGVGHELRNPLGVMTNAIYYLLMVQKEAPSDVKEYLEILRTQIALSEKIVGDLLDFARIKQPQLETLSVDRIVTEQLERVGSLNGVRLEKDIPSSLPQVRVDRVQMGQVVLNLVTNALQAMEGKNGTLTFRARPGRAGYVRLDVTDTGVGMTTSELEKMFEPLFTTKARGIGLGLAVSRSLVHANGGEISAVSEEGKGSTLSVEFPAAKGAAA